MILQKAAGRWYLLVQNVGSVSYCRNHRRFEKGSLDHMVPMVEEVVAESLTVGWCLQLQNLIV